MVGDLEEGRGRAAEGFGLDIDRAEMLPDIFGQAGLAAVPGEVDLECVPCGEASREGGGGLNGDLCDAGSTLRTEHVIRSNGRRCVPSLIDDQGRSQRVSLSPGELG